MPDFDGSGGLMNLFANPQTAGMLGAAGGLLSMSGPSRLPVSMGQVLGAGLQGGAQGYTGALNTQRQLLQMQALQGLMGAVPSQQPAQPSQPSYSSLFGPPSATPGSTSGVGGSTNGSSASGAPATGTIYGRTPQQLFQQG